MNFNLFFSRYNYRIRTHVVNLMYFSRFFSFNEFCQLRSLILIDLDHNNVEQIKSILLLLSDSSSDLMIHMLVIYDQNGRHQKYKWHHWYTHYELCSDEAFIYTIPYVWNKYMLTSNPARSGFRLMNNSKIFENMTDLSLFMDVIDNKLEYYFQNVKSLELITTSLLFKEIECNL